MRQPVIVAGARTPIGRLLGSLSPLSAPELGGWAIGAALERAGITGDQDDAVIMGQVVQAGAGPNPARLAAAAGGVPMSVPATTVNKACLSGLAAIAQAAQQIATGQSEVVVAGGMESMSNAPHLLPGARRGTRYGAAVLMDALDRDALICGFEGISMGAATDRDQARFGIARPDQDAFAAESHARAAAAIKAGRLAEEIVPVTVSGRGGDVLVEDDEGVRPDTTLRRGGPGLGPRPRHCPGPGQRQRRRHRPRPPGRHERRPAHPDPRARTPPSRRRNRRRRPLRSRRHGRRHHHPLPLDLCGGRLRAGSR